MAHRGRPITAATVGAALHTLVDGERPAWVSRETWRTLIAARDGLRADLLAAIEGETWSARESRVGASVKALRQWMSDDGWLAPRE